MTTGISLKTFERVTSLGVRMNGEIVTIHSDGKKARYEIQIGRDEFQSVVSLAPIGRGSRAGSNLSRSSYAYDHGGHMFQTAVDAAKELASALGETVSSR